MNAMLSTQNLSPDDLLKLPDGKHFELIDGKPVERIKSVQSSWIAGEILGLLGNYCYANRLGRVWPGDNGYQCFPGAPNLVRKPDVSFIQANRITPELLDQGFAAALAAILNLANAATNPPHHKQHSGRAIVTPCLPNRRRLPRCLFPATIITRP